jgi:hypothetical protein
LISFKQDLGEVCGSRGGLATSHGERQTIPFFEAFIGIDAAYANTPG